MSFVLINVVKKSVCGYHGDPWAYGLTVFSFPGGYLGSAG